MGEVTISLEEYEKLIRESERLQALRERVELFTQHVRKEDYSIDKKSCGMLLGFEVTENGDD